MQTSDRMVGMLLREAQAALQQERAKRLLAEQAAGGLKAANNRLQALVLRHRAEAAAAKVKAEAGD